ncbi:MAG: hypothetical protein KAW12_11675 [Candidatus Aminicenantes bacterium]|nr:hypothetical protein [Candidatus Aminicenantes bacterium]
MKAAKTKRILVDLTKEKTELILKIDENKFIKLEYHQGADVEIMAKDSDIAEGFIESEK